MNINRRTFLFGDWGAHHLDIASSIGKSYGTDASAKTDNGLDAALYKLIEV